MPRTAGYSLISLPSSTGRLSIPSHPLGVPLRKPPASTLVLNIFAFPIKFLQILQAIRESKWTLFLLVQALFLPDWSPSLHIPHNLEGVHTCSCQRLLSSLSADLLSLMDYLSENFFQSLPRVLSPGPGFQHAHVDSCTLPLVQLACTRSILSPFMDSDFIPDFQILADTDK